ncbi:MAG: hypothetical protein ABI837_05125 [Acidobacteriota bacterium]
MRTATSAALPILILLAGCRGEPVPRDYQNSPPAVTHPVTSSSETPSAHGMPAAAPQPSSGVEGINVTRKPANEQAGSQRLPDQAPSGTTATSVSAPSTATTATTTRTITPP